MSRTGIRAVQMIVQFLETLSVAAFGAVSGGEEPLGALCDCCLEGGGGEFGSVLRIQGALGLLACVG
jgi:hypothetical protein